MKTGLSQDRLKDLFGYNADTGLFYRKKKRSGCSFKKPPGNPSHGYIRIQIDGVSYQAHRLAWLYFYGEWPETDLDHINGDRSDNRIVNLRLATRSQNLMNMRTRRRGLKGVYFDKRQQRWCARIHIEYKTIWLGSHKTEEEAHAAYQLAAIEYHGEFARAS